MSGGVLVQQTAISDVELRAALARLVQFGGSPRAMFQDIAQYGETTTRIRFKNEVGPDGTKWRPSKRVIKHGGKTLQKTARLLRSITSHASNDGAEWGTNVIYGRIHQLGGTVERAARAGTLRLRTGRGGALLRQKDHANLAVIAKKTHKNVVEKSFTVGGHKITIPARPYLGVNEEDAQQILRIADHHVDQVARPGGKA